MRDRPNARLNAIQARAKAALEMGSDRLVSSTRASPVFFTSSLGNSREHGFLSRLARGNNAVVALSHAFLVVSV